MCVFLISSVSFICIYSQYIIKYLKEKYGSKEFEINDIDSDFTANGLIGTDNLYNYLVWVKYIPEGITFFVELDVDDKRNILINSSSDALSKEYFNMYFENEDVFKIE